MIYDFDQRTVKQMQLPRCGCGGSLLPDVTKSIMFGFFVRCGACGKENFINRP